VAKATTSCSFRSNFGRKSIQEKLASVGLTLSQVVNYVLKQTNKELGANFNPVDDSMKPYLFKKRK